MTRKCWILGTLAFELMAQLHPRLATAQEALTGPVPPSPGTGVPSRNSARERMDQHPFRVRAHGAAIRFEIRTKSDDVLARCVEDCQLNLPSGEYRAYLFDRSGKKDDVEFLVGGPGGIEIGPPDDYMATVGLALGILGPALIGTGMLLMVDGIFMCWGRDECDGEDARYLFFGGLGSSMAGVALTPIGWSIYARNSGPRIQPFRNAMLKPVVTRTRDGAILGFTGTF
jgi:hypothetical protein